MARKKRRAQRLKVVNPDCAGVDVGKDRHFVAVNLATSLPFDGRSGVRGCSTASIE